MLGWNSIPGALVIWRVAPTTTASGARLSATVAAISAAAATVTTAAATATRRRLHFTPAASVAAGVVEPLVTEYGSSAECSSSADCQRSAGFLARHRMTIAARPGAISLPNALSGAGLL